MELIYYGYYLIGGKTGYVNFAVPVFFVSVFLIYSIIKIFPKKHYRKKRFYVICFYKLIFIVTFIKYGRFLSL